MHNILVREKNEPMHEDDDHLKLGTLLKRKVSATPLTFSLLCTQCACTRFRDATLRSSFVHGVDARNFSGCIQTYLLSTSSGRSPMRPWHDDLLPLCFREERIYTTC